MKAICDRASLTHWVQLAAGIASARSPKPALACLRIEARPDGMTLLATDLEVGLRVFLDKMEVQEAGVVLIPADRLSRILSELDADQVTLTGTDQDTEIVAPGSRFKVLGDNPEDFPEVPAFPESGAFQTGAEDLQGLIQRTVFATAKENTRYALNGVLWEAEQTKLTLIATDGRRMSVVHGKCQDGPEAKVSAIVPSKAMGLLERCLGTLDDPKAAVRVALGEKDALVESPPAEDGATWTVYSRLVDGHFPKFEDVIPKDLDKKVDLPTEEFTRAVRRAALLTNEESRGIQLRFTSGELVVSSRTPEMGEAEIRMPIEYGDEDLEIGFNPAFVLDAVKVMDADACQIALKSSAKPGVLTEGKLFTYVLMPVTVV